MCDLTEPHEPVRDCDCKGCAIAERNRLRYALNESLKLQSHYAMLLNAYDGGTRMRFASIEKWMERL